jgi:hypothetical protein
MRRKLLLVSIWLLATFLLMEVATRTYLRLRLDVAFRRPQEVFYTFYPELVPVVSNEIRADDEVIDVLLLGGSVLQDLFGPVEKIILERLTQATRRPVRVHNVAFMAHTSRDSYLKYKRLTDQRFDLVVFYHGINEVRTNNAPADVFDPDYDHYSWYRLVNAIDRSKWIPYFATAYAVKHAQIQLSTRFGQAEMIPTHWPREAWLKYGGEVKTEASFRRNLGAILDLAVSRGDPVLVMTFATYLAPDYSLDGFRRRQLDYTLHMEPIELWGSPENVMAGIRAHNGVVRELARDRRGVYLVDQQEQMPGRRDYFNDVCHLTVAGASRFVGNMVPAMLAAIAKDPVGTRLGPRRAGHIAQGAPKAGSPFDPRE